MPLRPMGREQMWMLPPTLDELLPLDHPARFVAEFVDALDRDAWAELGVDIEGDSMGAPAYHPRALLSVWLYGFMTGVRSCRKLEVACRDQIPYLWLTGWQHPDHNALWRFYKRHRQAMRKLFERTVSTAVTMELVDLAVQAVDGTKVAANASVNRSYDAEGLRGLLDRLERAIADLEAQNEAGEEAAVARLPEKLADKEVLREQVRQAMAELASQKRHRRINLTDPDMKGRHGIIMAGYNAQAMVSATKAEEGSSGMLVTAVDVVDAANDNALLAPMMEQAEETTGTKSQMTLADAGYFAASHLAECDRRGQQVVVSEARKRFLAEPYHKDRFTYDEHSDSFRCPQGQTLAFVRIQHANGVPLRLYRGFRCCLSSMPGLQSLYQSQRDWAKPGHRAARRSPTWPSRLDVHLSSQRSLRAEKVTRRAGLRNHQGATGSTEVPAARPRQRGGRVDHVGHNLQPAHSMAGVERFTLVQPSISRSEALCCLMNRGDNTDQSPPVILHPILVSKRTCLQVSF